MQSDDIVSVSSFSVDPVYNVKAVCVRTGITAATLRAWERRYGLPMPDRSGHGYRLYSERDVAILFWLKRQTEKGVNIAHAVAQLKTLLGSGADPQLSIPPPASSGALSSGLRSPAILRHDILNALQTLDEPGFTRLMNEALAIYTIETALITILQLAVRDIRELRTQGTMTATTETLAISYAHQRLLHIAQTLPNARGGFKSVVMVGFSSEHNELDLLIIAILLRRQGITVIMLGTDLEPRMLEEAVAHLNAGVIVYYADEPRNVIRLVGIGEPRNAEGQTVRTVCCGLSLTLAPELKSHIRCEYIGADLREVVQHLTTYIQTE